MPSILRVMPTPAIVRMVCPHITDTWRSISRLHINDTRRRCISRSRRRCHYTATDRKRQCSSRNQSQGFHHIHAFCQKYTQLLQVDRRLWPSIRSFIFLVAERCNFPQIQGLQSEKSLPWCHNVRKILNAYPTLCAFVSLTMREHLIDFHSFVKTCCRLDKRQARRTLQCKNQRR